MLLLLLMMFVQYLGFFFWLDDINLNQFSVIGNNIIDHHCAIFRDYAFFYGHRVFGGDAQFISHTVSRYHSRTHGNGVTGDDCANNFGRLIINGIRNFSTSSIKFSFG